MNGAEYRKFLYEIVTPVMGGVIILMNVLELIVVRRQTRRLGVGVVYILNLSVSDVFVGVAMIVLKIMTQFRKTTLKNDAVGLEFYNIIKYCVVRLSLFVSVFNLIALTIDRLFAVKYPFVHRKQGKRFAFKICCAVWIMSVICVTIVYTISRFHLQNIARYNNLVFPVATYTACVVFIACYLVIFLELRNSVKNRQINRAGEERRGVEMNFLKLAIKTVAVFMICWVPFSTCSLTKAINGTCGGKNVEYSLFTLAYLNSVINPFIYFSHSMKVLARHWKRFTTYVGGTTNSKESQSTVTGVSTISGDDFSDIKRKSASIKDPNLSLYTPSLKHPVILMKSVGC